MHTVYKNIENTQSNVPTGYNIQRVKQNLSSVLIMTKYCVKGVQLKISSSKMDQKSLMYMLQ